MSTMFSTSAAPRRWMALAATAAATLTLAACGDDDASSDATSTTKADAAKVLGAPDKATGTPLKLGMISDGKGKIVDQSSEISAAKAAVAYLNEYRGGIAGRPVELQVCETKQTPAGATACVNEMLAAKVPVVFVGASNQGGVVASGVAKGGTVVVSDQAIEPSLFAQENSFILTNAIVGLFAAPAQTDRDAGIKRAAYVVDDVPAATEGVNSIGKAYFAAAGVDLDVVAVPIGTPDPTPQIQAAISKGAKAIHIIADSNLCTSALKAIQTLGFDGPVTGITQCFPGRPGEGLPKGAEGITLAATGATLPPKEGDAAVREDFARYEAVMARFAPGATTSLMAPIGYRVVSGFAAAVEGLEGDVTPTTVKRALATMKETPLPLGAGITIRCDGKQFSLGPAFCTSDALVAPLQKNGDLERYEPVKLDLELPTPGR